jgi:hypothetical protein
LVVAFGNGDPPAPEKVCILPLFDWIGLPEKVAIELKAAENKIKTTGAIKLVQV